MDAFQCYIAHRVHIVFLQAVCLAGADLPEIREWSVVPQKIAVRILIQFRDPDAILISRHFLCLDIHGNLRQVEVRTNSHSRCNTGFLQDMPRLRPRRRWMPSDANNPILMFRGWELYIKCEQEPMREMLCSRWFRRTD